MGKKIRISIYKSNKFTKTWITSRAGSGKAIGHPNEKGKYTLEHAKMAAIERAGDIAEAGGKCKVVICRTKVSDKRIAYTDREVIFEGGSLEYNAMVEKQVHLTTLRIARKKKKHARKPPEGYITRGPYGESR